MLARRPMPISLLCVGGLCTLFTSVMCCMDGRDLRIKAEECGLAHPTGDALRPLLDMVERSVGRDAGWDYRVPVARVGVGPLLEKRVQSVEDEGGGGSAVCGVQLAS